MAELKRWKAFAPHNGGWHDLFSFIRTAGSSKTSISSESFSILSEDEMTRLGEMCRNSGVHLV